MAEELHACPLCGGSQFAPYLSCKDYTVSDKKFRIVECQDCHFRFTNPRPDEQSIGKYYQSDRYISHSNTKEGLINWLYQRVRLRTLRQKLQLVNTLFERALPLQSEENKKKSILDYGCGTGEFLKTCQRDHWHIWGVEPDMSARQDAHKLTKAKIFGNLQDEYFDTHQFHVITMWHVIEHIHRLDETLSRLKTLLLPGGTLVVATPNSASYDAQRYQEYWAAYDVPRHLYHFTPDTMEKMLAKHGLRIREQLPMVYDAYYISMLSEKNAHKGLGLNLLRAVWNGWQSNRQAKAHNTNYSSVIYLVEPA